MTDQQAQTIARLLAELVRDIGENRKAINRVEELLRQHIRESQK